MRNAKEVSNTGGHASVFDSISDLGSLLEGSAAAGAQLQIIPINRIKPSPHQPRTEFDDTKLLELSESIREKGVVQPILVRAAKDGFELVAGERRWRAARKAGLKEIPAIVRDLDDDTAADVAFVENIQRTDLSVADEIAAVAKAVARVGTAKEVAKRYGKSIQWVSKRSCVAEASEAVLQFAKTGRTGDIDGLYELARLAAKEPKRAEKIIENFRDGMSLRRLVKEDGLSKSPPAPGDDETPKKSSGAGEGGRKGGATGKPSLVAGFSVAGPVLRLQTAHGAVELRFPKAVLNRLAASIRKLQPWEQK